LISFILFFSLQSALFAKCMSRNFNLSLLEETHTLEILEQFSSLCAFSVLFKDEKARLKLGSNSTLNIKNANLKEIFDILLKEKNLHYDFNGRVLKIASLKTQTFKLNYITSIREGQSIIKASVDARARQSLNESEEAQNDNMIVSVEKFDFWQDIEKELNLLLQSEGEEAFAPIINENTGLITLSGSASQLQRASLYIKNLQERLKKQVAIDVNIIAVSLDKAHSTGINWQNFNLSFNTANASGAPSNIAYTNTNSSDFFVRNLGFNAGINLSSIINFLNTNGKSKVLSNPKLMALNNQQAIISVGDTINYQVKESSKSSDSGTTVSEVYNNYSIFVGILLNILPEISDDGRIILRISPSLSSFKYAQDNRRQEAVRTIAPDTVQKKLSTVVQMENNQTLILGGLISHQDGFTQSEVKGLAKVPLLGALFRSKEQSSNITEIVFIIKPLIVESSNNPSLRDLGFKELVRKENLL